MLLSITLQNNAIAETDISEMGQQKEFLIKLSVDNQIKYSEDAATNVALSINNSFAYLVDKNHLADNVNAACGCILCRNLYFCLES